jgi:amino acid adenylation domain-containing protein
MSSADIELMKLELLRRRLTRSATPGALPEVSRPIARADRGQALPLSWAQQRLWFIDRLDHAGGSAYHVPAALRLRGTLDRAALQATLDRVVARHENLHTTFISVDGSPRQEIARESGGFALVDHDLRHLDDAMRVAAVADLSAEEARAPFDLSSGPLIRGRLLRLSDDEHVLLVTQHHIVSDAWSIGVLMREVSALYTAFTRGEPDPLPPLSIQYADYAVWQRQWLQGQVLQDQLDFWRGHLAGAPPLLELPTDRPRPPVQSYAGDRVPIQLPAELTQALRALSQRHGATLFMTLLAGWSVLLSRLSGQDEVVVGTPVANRGRAEVEPLIGFFINTLALRVDLQADPSVAALLAQIKTTMLGAYAHQDLPFEQVVEALQPARDLGQTPLFQVMLTLDNTPAGGVLTLPGLELTVLDTQSRHKAHFDLRLLLGDAGGDLRGELEYATDLFDRATVERMVAQWMQLLRGMVSDDTQRVGRLPLQSAAERDTVLTTFNATATDDPQDQLIHALFEEQVRRQPEAPALVCGDDALSYVELNRRANQVAHRLIALGVKPDDCVAIVAERSVAMVVGLLGVLKAGGAYVPLDPGLPPARLVHMLADCAPAAVLTQSALRAAVRAAAAAAAAVAPDQSGHGVSHEVLVLDDGSLDSQPTHDPIVDGLHARHLAYVIYTSGSTGRPKGVMVEHRSAVNFWRVMRRTTHRDCPPRARVALNAAFTFDMSLKGILQLLSGHGLVLIPEAIRASGPALLAFLEDERIDAVDSTPSQVAGLLAAGLLETTGRRPGAVLLGGEAISRTMWAQLQAAPHIHFFNMYGPTECTVDATIAGVRETARTTSDPANDGSTTGDPANGSPSTDGPTIGRPVANTRVYVLDRNGEPTPPGVAGELYLAGVQVARGYWNRPDLTEARFLPDPFVSAPTAGTAAGDAADVRMYKTGDLGRWRPDGTLEYLGRNDFQVKIRGYRIELGEIEAHLRACDGVRDAVVIAREDVPGDAARLVAYVVPHDGVDLLAAELRDQLSRELADYMLPSAFVSLPALPLTSHGKLDRRALPPPDQAAVASREYEAPVGEIEEAIAAIWQELLGLERVGRHDHFFELGGHSLLAVQVATRVNDLLGVELPLREVFAQPTLKGLAEVLPAADLAIASAIAPIDRREILPLSWAQQRLWFLGQLDPAASTAYHLPATFRLSGDLDRAALQATFDRIVARHENLRTRFVRSGEAPAQVIAPADVGFTLIDEDLRGLDAEAREAAIPRLGAQEASAPFDLSTGPLLRGRLLRLAAREYILLLTQHHIITDGWSLGVLVREVVALYTAFSRGEPDPLPPLAIQYADYAAWQRRWLQGDVLQEQLAFWQRQLEGAPGRLELPADRPRPPVQSYAGDRVPLRIPDDLHLALRALCQRHGTTMFMTLLAGWSVLLSRLSGQGEVVVGTPVANRQRSEVEPLTGFFLNTLALRVDLQADPSVAELLAQIKTTTLGAYAHQDLPFEQIVEALQPARDLGQTPLFQVMLTLDNTPRGGVLALPGLELTQVDTPYHKAHFDLRLLLGDAGGDLRGELEYATDLFDRATVERMLAQWMHVLRGMVSDDARRVSRLPLLSAAERDTVLTTFNATATGDPQDQLIHALFEEQVRRQPDAPALVCGDDALDYAELNRRANQVAHRLRALGVKPDDRVAICAERSLAMVIGLLGVLKAGGAYVPLDPAAPSARLAHMLADCAPAAVLTQSALRAAAAGLGERGVPPALLVLDDGSLDAQPTHDPIVDGLHARHLAYVIYTSGSTGRPKGVMVEHRSAVNFWRVMSRTTHRDCPPRARVALNAAFTFDMSLKGILQLLSGHCLVLIPEAIRASGPALLAFLEQERIDAVDSTPSQIAGLLAAGLLDTTGRRPGAVLLGGEAIPRAMWAQLEAAPHIHFFNMYGPTECTVDATIASVRDASSVPAIDGPAIDGSTIRSAAIDGPAIGRPVANTRVYVLDANREPTPIGVPGELYLAGVQVARGYWNRPDLTETRFLPDPFVSDPTAGAAAGNAADARMYKTGDLGRWRPDGTLEYLGRNDFQVKIRGYRIELGEIETALMACDGVRDAVVLSREDTPGDPRLVAYIVPHDGVDLAAADLRQQLSRDLADYMLPSAFVCLPALPLTPHGKLDRRALPPPDQSAVVSRAYEAPAGEIEETIAAIWQELLGLERVGRHDHFFELGGHSLLAMQLVLRVRERFEVDVPLRALFEQPVLSFLAESVVSAQMASFAASDVADIEQELAGRSEEELRAMLSNGVTHER